MKRNLKKNKPRESQNDYYKILNLPSKRTKNKSNNNEEINMRKNKNSKVNKI